MSEEMMEPEVVEFRQRKIRRTAAAFARRDGFVNAAAAIERGEADEDSFVQITEAIFFKDMRGEPILGPS